MSTERLANQKRATEEFIAAWSRLAIEDMVKLCTSDCIQETIPKASLQVPDQTNDAWVTALRPVFKTLSNFRVGWPA